MRSAHRRARTSPQVSARNETIQKLREELEEIKTGTVTTLRVRVRLRLRVRVRVRVRVI